MIPVIDDLKYFVYADDTVLAAEKEIHLPNKRWILRLYAAANGDLLLTVKKNQLRIYIKKKKKTLTEHELQSNHIFQFGSIYLESITSF